MKERWRKAEGGVGRGVGGGGGGGEEEEQVEEELTRQAIKSVLRALPEGSEAVMIIFMADWPQAQKKKGRSTATRVREAESSARKSFGSLITLALIGLRANIQDRSEAKMTNLWSEHVGITVGPSRISEYLQSPISVWGHGSVDLW